MQQRPTTVLLPELLHGLADLHEGKGDLSGVEAVLEKHPDAGVTRFYYEAILGRSPESGDFATRPVKDRLKCALFFLGSDEFLGSHIQTFRTLFPNIKASIFLHIPKSGGSTLIESQRHSHQFAFFTSPEFFSTWESDRISYYGGLIASLRSPNRTIAIIGHPTGRFLIDSNIKRENDEVYAILRDPFSTMVSFINYILTCVAENRPGRDVERWRSVIGIPSLTSKSPIPSSVLLKVLHELIGRNVLCATLSATGRFEDAVESIKILGLQPLFFEDIDCIIKQKGLPSVPRENTSVKFVTEANIEKQVREAINSYIEEDIKLYDWARHHLNE